MTTHRVRRGAAIALAVLLATCSPADRPDEAGQSPSLASLALYVNPRDYDFSANPALLGRILSDPHGYFRFINIPFSQRVCGIFADRMAGVSSERARSFELNLHGDAHVEQYAVTDLGRGLTDFDDASQGPPFLDLMRFAVSLRLASRLNGWDAGTEEELVRTFLDGYRSALADPGDRAPEPAVAARLRSMFSRDTAAYLAWVDAQMGALPPEEERNVRGALASFAVVMAEEHDGIDPSYFTPVGLGSLDLGVGSALDTKYLVRLRGSTDDPRDDDVLEIKRVRDLAGIDCIRTKDDDPFRVLLSQARVSYEPFRWLGYVRIGEANFWTHGWVQNYAEMDVDQTFRTPDELAEVAYDAGIQLGVGHPKLAAAPFGQALRRQTIEHLDAYPGEIERVSRDLAAEVLEAWSRFVAEVQSAGTAGPGGS